MDIPIIVVCYNNYKYVKNTLKQILKINKDYYKNIQILNNNSTCQNTINYLKGVDVKVINNSNNAGPWISSYQNAHIYNVLPDKFILTDPDLKLNENIPNNFIEMMSFLSDKYRTRKIGFALDISDFDKFYKNTNYCDRRSIYHWETKFWNSKIHDDDYELYAAPIDTTFCLINKNNSHGEIRIAGNFTAKHLPWYVENEIYNTYENYINSVNTTCISTIAKIVIQYVEDNYSKIYKNNELFLIKPAQNLYSWKDEMFEMFDRYLSQDKIFIDVGCRSGINLMYGSRKSKHVYSIGKLFSRKNPFEFSEENEKTPETIINDNDICVDNAVNNNHFDDGVINLKTNCTNNYTLINNAFLHFDPASHNDANSENNPKNCLLETNTTKTHKINVSEISFINVDMTDGIEENVLNELFYLNVHHNVPLHIQLNYGLWKDKNLDRFPFLLSDVKNKIKSNPSIVIFFDNQMCNPE